MMRFIEGIDILGSAYREIKIMSDEKREYFFLQENDENRELLSKRDKCDKYDYIAAIACGAIGGMIDIFGVGAPGDSVLGNWTDEQTNNVVKAFAKKLGWSPKEKNLNNVNSAIGFLERRFKVNYDQRKPGDVNNLFNIAPGTHHMMSLAHSPDIVGLFFSILNQFTLTSSFIANGQLVTVASDSFELCGGNFLMKIMCGVSNWFGHLMSDVAGSSGSHKRGTGIVIPFYEFFGFCKFGNFPTESGQKDLAEIALQAFNQGYDLRFGIAQMIPLAVTELSIRLVWAIKQRFQYHKAVGECIPTMHHPDLRVLLLIGNGTLCVMDGIDAGIKAGGNSLVFFMRLNLPAWFRFATMVLKEVFIRVGIADALQMNIDAFKRVNEALLLYLRELKKIDIEQFKEETEKYNTAIGIFSLAKSERDLNTMLMNIYEEIGISMPWQGEFNEFMSDSDNHLVFE